ncbi:Ankyrin repeat, PH and SEC7 domain containing protein secG [Tetrabaena socialis]|uniref:Ankyrin repeat, PH and SEC7 domain containing protein secG n=1 Tax=Tetrabaena socialis TaxID=47790 RepID=A0A2J7ZLE9_9CHLO|nr:Ankyrin repeat, PH and SEC7 domain containing protein secG [Tetrabaena socialis]|eukprot:PNH01094.1 Ankyrin repeat, PH and SEC7 domain containing protein secG [Tetrabaena socialis]
MSIEVRARTRSKPNTVHYAAETGDIKLLEHFVREGMAQGNPESVTLQAREDVLGMMPLHVACENGELEAVEFLVKKRVDVDAGDHFKVTALHLAAIEDHADIADVLLKARADPKPADVEGDLPIHWAATKGHSQVIELLARKNSPVDTPNKKGWTPLHRAAYNGRKEAVVTLVKLGASVSGVTSDGNTPLHLACFMNQLATIEKLCEIGGSQRLVNKNNQRPFDLCITDAARDILKGLLGFEGDSPLPASSGTKSKDAPAGKGAAGKPVIPNLAALQIGNNKKPTHDGFPSPVGSPGPGSFSAPKAPAGGTVSDSGFMQTALGETGTNPYTGMSAGNGGGSADGPSGRGAGPGPGPGSAAASTEAESTSASGPGGGLAAHRTPLAGSLRPLRAPSPSGAGGGPGAGLLLRPPSTGRAGTPGSTSASGELSPWAVGSSGGGVLSPHLLGEDVQDRIKEENRRMALSSASNDVLRPRSARPVSANKKFLSRYSLDKYNLFAP